jgi:uncharacterized membrane protein YeaQ/YmgE (transglycosylase-associated protein family)
MTTTNILVWLIFGGIAGWIATIIYGNNGRVGILGNIVIGIIGAILGGWVFGFFGQTGVTGFNLWSFLVAVVGAVILLWLVNMGRKKV